MKKQPKSDVSLESPGFAIPSLMVFPFEKFLTDNLKTYGLMDPVIFLKMCILIFFKM